MTSSANTAVKHRQESERNRTFSFNLLCPDHLRNNIEIIDTRMKRREVLREFRDKINEKRRLSFFKIKKVSD